MEKWLKSSCDDANDSNDDVCHNMGREAGARVWLGQVDTAGGGGGGRTTSSRRRSGSAAQIPQSCAGCVQKWWVGASCGGAVSEAQWMAAGQEVSLKS